MYLHKTALGLGLMRPNTILTSLALKLYIGHTRLNSPTNDLITANLQMVQVEAGRNINFEDIDPNTRTWNETWIDRVFSECRKREISVERETNFLKDVTRNRTVMDFAVDFADSKITLGRINQVRKYKKVLLPIELVGSCGSKLTDCAIDIETKSPINWEFMKDDTGFPQHASIRTWKNFVQ